MKKTIIPFIAIVMVLATVSCTKEYAFNSDNRTEDLVFSATIDNGIETKTTITSERKVNWESGDNISINGIEYLATPKSDATKADFTKGSGNDPEPTYKAYFPASLYNGGTPTLPAVQTYAAGKFNAPMYAESETNSLSFKNVCGVLCFSLKGTEKVKNITVSTNEANNGAFTMTETTAISLTGTGKTITLDCSEGVQLNAEAATNFYIYLPPQTYTAGMKIVIATTDGKIFEKTTTKSAVVSLNKIYSFNWIPEFKSIPPVGALPGKFTVADDGNGNVKMVHFSRGNLYYDGSNFDFEDEQYKFHGYDSESNIWGLFGWSTNATTYGMSESYDPSTYSGAFVDWGKAIGDGNAWRTLSTAEWQYLFNTRTVNGGEGAEYSYSLNIIYGGVPGVALYPDNYTGSALSGTVKTLPEGVVFLPAARGREGSRVYYSSLYGNYWSSTATAFIGDNAYYVFFNSEAVYPDLHEGRYYGFSVRLVTDVPEE